MSAPKSGEHWGIFGGAFDPVHLGHMAIAADLKRSAALHGIIFVPSGKSPHRPSAVASFADRVAMLTLAIGERGDYLIDRTEETLPGPAFSLTVIEQLKSKYPGVSYSLLIGADQWQNFDSWHRPEEIIRQVQVIIGARPGSQPGPKPLPANVIYFESSLLDISSTKTRKFVRDGISEEKLSELVPRPVAQYIIKKHLYRHA